MVLFDAWCKHRVQVGVSWLVVCRVANMEKLEGIIVKAQYQPGRHQGIGRQCFTEVDTTGRAAIQAFMGSPGVTGEGGASGGATT